jgi:hypothetical protein
MTTLPTVISCKGPSLASRGYDSFETWAAVPGHIYIGRDMSRFINGAVGSKWGNPFKETSGMTLEERIDAYEAMVRGTPSLMCALHELEGARELGCWCAPHPCHGHVLVRLLSERRHCGVEVAPPADTLAPLATVEEAPVGNRPSQPQKAKKKNRLQ